jgi:1,4-dihydroxy-2-naphthoate polyprenyltransferase
VFLLPGAAMSAFGALLAENLAVGTAIVHLVVVSLAVYVAHLKDGYVDYYLRGEDDENLLAPATIRLAIVLATMLFAVCVALLWREGGPLAVAVTVPLLALGYLHAPHLDTNPVTVTIDYPLGIVVATAGGYVSQTGTVRGPVTAVCLVLFALLSAISILIDITDYRADRRVSKRTIPVAIGPERARSVAWLLVLASLLALLFSSTSGVLPRTAAVAGIVPAGTLLVCVGREPTADRAVALFIRATYVFAGLLFASIRLG